MSDGHRAAEGSPLSEGPRVERVRHELRRRALTVTRVERLPANMIRIVLGGEELRGFTSLGFDDHVKVFFPADGREGAAMRDFTPRRYDPVSGELWIDFYLHEGGPAAAWAAQAAAGQPLQIGGPKGSAIIALDGIDTHIFIGDETALPAIGRRLEELPATGRAIVMIELEANAERPLLTSAAAVDVIPVPRDGRGGPPARELMEALGQVRFPSARSFIWVATESRAARAIRTFLRDERGIDKRWIKAAGYWQRGAAGAHERIAEDE